MLPDLRDAHPSLEELTAFDRGHLRRTEREAVERHIADCATCCQRLDGIADDNLIALLRHSADLAASTAPLTSRPLPGLRSDGDGAAPATELPAELVDHPRYRVLALLGSGGMGVVFKAEHRLMERTVALKIIHKNLTQRPELVERFRHEVKAAARLSHPNIATAHDAEQSGDLHFLVMEYVEGTSLEQVVRTHGPLPVAQACDIARQAALGLQHAHEHGMVHRDIKPQNLLLTPAGQVKILDFGLARFCSESNGGALTAPGAIVGTPDFLAPEQALDARQADVRADIYSLGCTLYYLLAGRPPFVEGSALQKLLLHQQRTPPPLATLRADIPPALAHVLERMMAKDPAQRYPTAAEVADQLAPFAHGTGVVSVPAPSGAPRAAADTPTVILLDARRLTRSGLRRWLTLSLVAVALLGAILLGAYLLWRKPVPGSSGEATGTREGAAVAASEPSPIASPVRPCFRVVLAPSCQRALVAGPDFHVYLEELQTTNTGQGAARVLGQLKGHTDQPLSFAFSRDGRRALSGGMDHTVCVWDLEERRLLRTFAQHTSWVRGVAFVAETGLALSADNNSMVLLWDTRDGRLIHRFAGHEGIVFSVMVAPSGRWAVTSSDDRTVRVWDLTRLHEAYCLRGHEGRTNCAVLSPDERLVVSGSIDKTVRVWDLKEERVRWVLRGHTATVNKVAVSSDGRRAVSADAGGGLRLWDLETGKELRAYQTPGAKNILAVAFAPDGKHLVSAGNDGVFRWWRLP